MTQEPALVTSATAASSRLRRHLVDSGLAGAVATSPRNSVDNCARLLAGDPRYTFGLSDWLDATFDETVGAVRSLCGGDLGDDAGDGPGWIDPDSTLAGIARHRDTLAAVAAAGQARVLLATGHPTGLLAHYGAVARALQAAGCAVLTPLDDVYVATDHRRRRGIRFLDGVACVFDGGKLLHSHRSRYMEAMLDELGGGPGAVDLVVGDHGMAGAAVERGIPALSIADVNDPALPLAQARGRTDGVLVIDDNLAPSLFVPVTAVMLDGAARPRP